MASSFSQLTTHPLCNRLDSKCLCLSSAFSCTLHKLPWIEDRGQTALVTILAKHSPNSDIDLDLHFQSRRAMAMSHKHADNL